MSYRCVFEAVVACVLLVFGGWLIGAEIVPWWLGAVPVVVVAKWVVFLVIAKQMGLVKARNDLARLIPKVEAMEERWTPTPGPAPEPAKEPLPTAADVARFREETERHGEAIRSELDKLKDRP